MATPATNNSTPDRKMSPGSRENCSANAGKEARLSSIAAAMAASVGPIRPAIIFEVVITGAFLFRRSDQAHVAANAWPRPDLGLLRLTEERAPRQHFLEHTSLLAAPRAGRCA